MTFVLSVFALGLAQEDAIIEKVRPSVVRVTVRVTEPGPSLTFSGVVYRKDGYIVTDASGVESAVEIHVAIGDRTLVAKHVASDRRSGVAVLKVDADDLVPAALVDDPGASSGTVIAVGRRLAVGTVRGFGHSITVAGRAFDDMIQMTAPVSAGDCGGFVADSAGRLIGLVHSVGAEDAQGLGLLDLFLKEPRRAAPASFATSAEWVRFSADRIIKHGRMVRGWLGLSARPLEGGVGARVTRVEPDSPARRARISTRDTLVEFDGKPVTDIAALRKTVAFCEHPRTVKLALLRDGERREVEVEIEIGK